MAASRVTDRDRGARALTRRLEVAKNKAITVGIHEAEGGGSTDGGATVADIGTIHEFGLGAQQARPFVSGWADEYAATHQENMRKLGAAVVAGKVDIEKGLEQLALKYAGECQANFRNLPPVESKPGGTPLVETGQLRSAIRGMVK